MTYIKQTPEALMTVVFCICLLFLVFAVHTHDATLIQWAMGIAAMAFSSITTLVTKGLLSGQSQQTVVTPDRTVTTQKEGQ